jgi:hypothetical protein
VALRYGSRSRKVLGWVVVPVDMRTLSIFLTLYLRGGTFRVLDA